MFIYPITIVLILLNIVPKNLASPVVFKIVVLVTFIFSIPGFLQFIIDKKQLVGVTNLIPFAKHHLGWVVPAILSFVVVNIIKTSRRN